MLNEAYFDEHSSFLRNQDISPGYFEHKEPATLIFVSHVWETPQHPDPDSKHFLHVKECIRQLRSTPNIAKYFNHDRDFIGDRFAVFYDYSSLPQKPRTDDETVIFRRGLRAMLTVLIRAFIFIKIDDDRYNDRLWCRMESMYPMFSYGFMFGIENNWLPIESQHIALYVHRRRHIPPDELHKFRDTGVLCIDNSDVVFRERNGSACFADELMSKFVEDVERLKATNGSDRSLVVRILAVLFQRFCIRMEQDRALLDRLLSKTGVGDVPRLEDYCEDMYVKIRASRQDLKQRAGQPKSSEDSKKKRCAVM